MSKKSRRRIKKILGAAAIGLGAAALMKRQKNVAAEENQDKARVDYANKPESNKTKADYGTRTVKSSPGNYGTGTVKSSPGNYGTGTVFSSPKKVRTLNPDPLNLVGPKDKTMSSVGSKEVDSRKESLPKKPFYITESSPKGLKYRADVKESNIESQYKKGGLVRGVGRAIKGFGKAMKGKK